MKRGVGVWYVQQVAEKHYALMRGDRYFFKEERLRLTQNTYTFLRKTSIICSSQLINLGLMQHPGKYRITDVSMFGQFSFETGVGTPSPPPHPHHYLNPLLIHVKKN